AVIHHLPFARVAAQLPQGMGEAAWEAIRPNLARISEAAEWWQVIAGPIEAPAFDEETRAFLAIAAETLDSEWGDDPWHALTGAL
ncbi:hypothetical protein ABTB81_19605, partial [Acinetobacter baumannii]